MRANYNIRAALFDLDGVVVYTDKFHFLAWKKLADEEGWYFDKEINNRLRGVSRERSLELILEHNSVIVSQDSKARLLERKNTYYVELLKSISKADMYVGVEDFIGELRARGIKIALCSSSRNAKAVLEYLNITEMFDAVITGDDIIKVKPDPEIFVTAAKQLCVHPFNCVVFEDAITGIEGARRADMKTCGVGNAEVKDIADEFIVRYDEIDIEMFLESGRKRFFDFDPYMLKEREFCCGDMNKMESLFALGNGYMGIRGVYDETDIFTEDKEIPGMYINGVFDTKAYTHLWNCKGFAKAEQFTVNLMDWRLISLYVDGEKACFSNGTMKSHERALDMKNGLLSRSFIWESSTGKRVLVRSTRIVNMKRVHSAEISYSVTPLNFDGDLELISEVKIVNLTNGIHAADKGICGTFDGIRYATLRTVNTGIDVALAYSHSVVGEIKEQLENEGENGCRYIVKVHATRNSSARLDKYIALYSTNDDTDNIISSAVADIKRNICDGFDMLASEQRCFWDNHWKNGNVLIKGNAMDDFAVRFNLFHIRQQIPGEGARSVGATGLTGYSYSGKVFWDTEMYIIPYINYTKPKETKEMLMYRYKILDKARERAAQLDGKGALYSWCSIDGEETSVVFEASTAEYHIESDIAYAINRYFRSTGDKEFLFRYGAEILFETARFMLDRGAYIAENGGSFCINAVCGPDEYACGVNNNFYTNMMLRFHFRFAAEVYFMMKKEAPDRLSQLEKKTEINQSMVHEWEKAADKMYYRYNVKLGIFEQDDSFITNDPVNIETIPRNFDIRSIMHPLDLWRKQILKQADVVMLMFILGEEYTIEQKKANYEYYEPKTNHGSSLSPAVHSIIANEIGKYQEAYDYFRCSAYMDLGDFKKNASEGLHMACLGGTWMTVVNGFLGIRDYNDKLIISPRLPEEWTGCEVNFTYRGSEIKICSGPTGTQFILLSGKPVTFECYGKKYILETTIKV